MTNRVVMICAEALQSAVVYTCKRVFIGEKGAPLGGIESHFMSRGFLKREYNTFQMVIDACTFNRLYHHLLTFQLQHPEVEKGQ